MRLLALDLGRKTIGCATSDEGQVVASPRGVIARRGEQSDLDAVERVAHECAAAGIVVGLPLSLEGAEGPGARRARRFAEKVARRLGLGVFLWDERFSTSSAARALLEGDVKRARRKEIVDQVAAAIFLQSFLDAHGAGAEVLSAGAARPGVGADRPPEDAEAGGEAHGGRR